MTAMVKNPGASSTGDMLFGMGSRLLYAATRVALPPLALSHMGLSEYGLWSTCFVLVSYIGMAASGFSLVFLRDTARHHQQGDTAAISRLLVTGMLTLAAVALALMALLWVLMPTLLDVFRVDAAQRELARDLWLGAVGVFLADMSLGAFAHVLHAVGRLRQEQKVWVAAFLVETVLVVAFLASGWGVRGLLAAFAGRYLFSALANAVLALQALPGLRWSWRHFDPSLLRNFVVFGAGMQVSGLVATALQSADRLLGAALMGPQAAAVLDLASKVPVTAASVCGSASSVAVSAAARHDAGQRRDAVLGVYHDASRMTVASLALVMPLLAACAPWWTLAWLGNGSAQVQLQPLVAAVVLGLHVHMLTGPATAVARGLGQLRADFEYHAWRIGALLLSMAAWHRGWPGSLQAFVGCVVAGQVLAAATYLARAHLSLGLAPRGLLVTMVLPTATCYALAWLIVRLAPPGAAGLADGRGEALWSLCLVSLTWLPLAAASLAALLLNPHERDALLRRWPRLLRWRRI